MNAKAPAFSDLPNLGAKITAQLRGCGIASARELARVGPAAAYRRLCRQAGRRLPVCYYLYSLEGALRGVHWSALSVDEKHRLRIAAGEAATAKGPRRQGPPRARA